ncbi:MAG: polyprenol monophosphomannose synthase [Elusimicrobiota bacterium]
MKILVIIPTYNERENINKLSAALIGLKLQSIDILIIDDNSPDGTGAIADELKKEYSGRVEVIHRTAKLGMGTAYRDGFRYALDNGYDVIIQMDADYSHRPEYIPDFLKTLESADVVIGSRFFENKISVVNWPLGRLALSYVGNKYVNLLLGLKLYDGTTGFKCISRKVIEKIGPENLKSKGFSFQVELNYLAIKNGFRVVEIPIVFYNRGKGYSKMTHSIVWEAIMLVLRLKLES